MKGRGCFAAALLMALLFQTTMISPAAAAESPTSPSYVYQPQEEWNRTFGGPYGDGVWSMQETDDQGFVMAGYTSSLGQRSDLWLIKTDSGGREEWNRTFGGSDEDVGYFVSNIKEGGFIVVGSTKSYGVGEERLWLIKVDSEGRRLWDRTFGGFVSSAGDGGWSANETDDGGYIIAGYTRSKGSGGKDLWLIKVDAAGEKEWDRTFGGKEDDAGMSVIQSDDGGYVVAGRTASYGSGKDDIWLLKVDSSGRERWNRTFGKTMDDVGFQVLEVDGGYIVVGRTEPGGNGKRATLIRTDLRGSKVWEKTYRIGSSGISVQIASDGGFVISGSVDLPNGDRDAALIKTDPSGREEWTVVLGGPGEEIGSFALQSGDAGFALAGITDSFGAGAEDAWLFKLRPAANQSNPSSDDSQGDSPVVPLNSSLNSSSTKLRFDGALENRTDRSATANESASNGPFEGADDASFNNQNIFKQKSQSLPDVFPGQDLGYKPLRPLPPSDLFRYAEQSAKKD